MRGRNNHAGTDFEGEAAPSLDTSCDHLRPWHGLPPPLPGTGGQSGVSTHKPPCVGICYYNRLNGIVKDPAEEAARQAR